MPRVLINSEATSFGTASSILLGMAYQYEVRDFPGPLSVKTVARGRARWKTEDGEFWVDERSFLVLNDQEPYSITVDSTEKVETCCLFFQTGLLEAVFRALTSAPDRLLDEPVQAHSLLHFVPQLQWSDERIFPRMKEIGGRIRSGAATQGWLEEQVLLAARDVVALDEGTRRQIAGVPASRQPTREEIYKRLCRARDYIYTYRDQPMHLEDVSRAACLSPYHLHRLFKQTFHETPHEFLTRIRLEQARDLLVSSELPVTQICLGAGFESLGSFSTLFRRIFGLSPREFRRRSSGS